MVTKALKRRSNSAKSNVPVVTPKMAETNPPKSLKKQRLLLNSDSSIEGGRFDKDSTETGNTGPTATVRNDDVEAPDAVDPSGNRDPPVDEHVEKAGENVSEDVDNVDDQPVTDIDTDAELASDDNDDEDERMDVDDDGLDGEAISGMFETA